MKLKNKKELAGKALNVGKDRIIFVKSRLDEIKEAITKQDIISLHKEKAIRVKDVKGRRKIEKRKRKRSVGKIRRKVNVRKKEYAIMTRKLRKHVAELKEKKKLQREEILEIRKKIRNKDFRSLVHLKEYIGGLKK